ncbi:MAG TPA: glycoside hydrolase family 71/99-like protein [Puia sp.]|nr:glycoside hydrolase family 71/99-like protein [Puia sp.]
MKKYACLIGFSLLNLFTTAQQKHSPGSSFKSYKGLIMAGYQGWFNAPADGAGMGWNHYATHGRFEPGYCKVDFWPDTKEYSKVYETPFKTSDGGPAYIFSSYDRQSVFLHFKWMKEYGVDGAFIQRSVTALKSSVNLNHDDRVLMNAIEASRDYGRAIAIMYDFSGINDSNSDWKLIINDWKHLVDSIGITSRGRDHQYLYHHGKPLVALWGVGFPDRTNNLKTIEKIIDFLKNDPVYGGCSILLGVPAYWRDFGADTEKDPYLHQLMLKADIIRPWFVGRFDEQTYPGFKTRIGEDIKWCRQNNLDYVPVVFPGFSWHNMHPESTKGKIARNKGRFYWQQLTGAIEEGSEMIYIAMFDEIDEGTAIFKTAKDPPVGASHFENFEPDIPNDYYLYLTGVAAKMLRKEIPLEKNIPPPLTGSN